MVLLESDVYSYIQRLVTLVGEVYLNLPFDVIFDQTDQ